MKFKIEITNCDSIILDDIKSVNVLMKKVGKIYLDTFNENYPSTINITIYVVADGYDEKVGSLSFQKRGEVKALGIPSMHCSNQSLDVDRLLELGLKDYINTYKELRYLDIKNNSYKKYIIEGDKDKTIARYGGIDVPYDSCRVVTYPKYMFYILYFEKISKGYIDYTYLLRKREDDTAVAEAEEPDTSDNNTYNKVDVELYEELLSYSKSFVKAHLETPEKFTKKQILKARSYFEKLKKATTVDSFNNVLSELVMLSPRKRNVFSGDKIKSSFATDTSDFLRILDFEETLLIAMETVYKNQNNIKVVKNPLLKCFEKEDIDVFLATDAQKQEVLSYLSPYYQNKVDRVYRVKPRKQEEIFRKYVKENNIKNIKKLWHGSVNSNWLSIVENGLIITKSAANGRMFGDGIYFANSDDKSFGYTSYSGSRWAKGHSDVAIMGLYATAYGTPEYPTGWGAMKYTEDSLKNNGKNCVHATASNTGLRKDEIIFYNKEAVCLNYLVFFK